MPTESAAPKWRRFWYRHAKIASQADVDKIEGQVREEGAVRVDKPCSTWDT
jgi:hypothetical protein